MSTELNLRVKSILKEISTGIAGSHFYSKTVRSPLRLGDSLTLIRDPQNPHDQNAIRIERASGEILGFVPKELAVTLAAELDSGLNVYAFLSAHSYVSWTVTIFLSALLSDELRRLIENKRALAILQSRLEWAVRNVAEKSPVIPESPTHSTCKKLIELQFAFGKSFLNHPSRFGDALHFIGYSALNGHGQAKQLVRELYEQCDSDEWIYSFAQAGHPEAQFQLAHEYFGRRRADVPRAVKYWRLAAEQGHLKSQQRLAFLYEVGDGVSKDPEQSLFWKQRAETRR